MFEDATVMATEDEMIMININTNILVDSILLNAVDGTATLNGKPIESVHHCSMLLMYQLHS